MNNRKIFIIRLIAFTMFGCIAPFLFISFRYNLFKKVNDMALSGWGIVGILILFFFVKYVLKMLKTGLPFSMFTQCISGILKVILPLVCVYMLVEALKGSIDYFAQALAFTIVCEIIAIPINPLPKWLAETKQEQLNGFAKKFAEIMKGDEQ